INIGQPHHVAFTIQPTGTTAGAVLNFAGGGFEVTVQDQVNNKVTSSSATITLTLNNTDDNSTGSFASGTSSKAATSGAASFGNLIINDPAHYTLTASSGNLAVATSNQFTITFGAAHHVAFNVQPSGTT